MLLFQWMSGRLTSPIITRVCDSETSLRCRDFIWFSILIRWLCNSPKRMASLVVSLLALWPASCWPACHLSHTETSCVGAVPLRRGQHSIPACLSWEDVTAPSSTQQLLELSHHVPVFPWPHAELKLLLLVSQTAHISVRTLEIGFRLLWFIGPEGCLILSSCTLCFPSLFVVSRPALWNGNDFVLWINYKSIEYRMLEPWSTFFLLKGNSLDFYILYNRLYHH